LAHDPVPEETVAMLRPRIRAVRAIVTAAMLLGRGGLAAEPLVFEVSYTPNIAESVRSGHVYVFLAEGVEPAKEPRLGPDWFRPAPVFVREVTDWKPGEPLRVGATARRFPGPPDGVRPGPYSVQAVLRLNGDTHRIGAGEGNAYGPVVRATLDPRTSGTVRLEVNRVVPPRAFRETARRTLVDIPSPQLSRFRGRPSRHRAAVLLPETPPGVPCPTLYIIPGFGGDHHMAEMFERDPRLSAGKRGFVRVLLDPDCGLGHHAFADSAANGPRGTALVEELIPYIEARFPVVRGPHARFVTGHSSGGWSSLWLQVTYPDAFAGVWSTSPDPVDFRDFSGIDIYASGENMFRDRAGRRRPIIRGPRGEAAVLLDDFCRMEDTLGDGGQLGSFEAVFSPLDEHGRPKRLWDRMTGAIDPDVARAWESYDIRRKLQRDWPALGPKLAGKLHVYVGAHDTFYLEGAVRLLRTALATLDSDARVEIVPGKDHATLLDRAFATRLDEELTAAWRARSAP
jgi:hypothetical protein